MPRIIILTPCFNEEKRIDAYIDSLERQSLKVELIAIDDGSTDNTLERLKRRNILYAGSNQTNLGIARTFNRLFDVVKDYNPDYLTWGGVDEELYPDAIEKRLNFLTARNCDVVITGADAQTISRKIVFPDLLPQFAYLTKANFNNLHEELLSGNFIPTPVLVDMRKVDINDCAYNETTPNLCDWDQMLTLSKKYKFAFLNESTGCSDWDGGNFSTSNPARFPKKLREHLNVLGKHLKRTNHRNKLLFTGRVLVKTILRFMRYFRDVRLLALAEQRAGKTAQTERCV